MSQLPTDFPPGEFSAELVTGSRSSDLSGDPALPQLTTLAPSSTVNRKELSPPGSHIGNLGPPLRSVYNSIHFSRSPRGDEVILVTDLEAIDFTDEHISAHPRIHNTFLEKLAVLSHHPDRPVLLIFIVSKNYDLQRCHFLSAELTRPRWNY